MLFADRVIFTEGESEPCFLPGISSIVTDSAQASCDYDARNISAIRVGGKKSFKGYSKAAEGLRIQWRIVTDCDSLDDNSLDHFFAVAGVKKTDSVAIKRTALLRIGVAVLGLGEIEDYYPQAALAEIAGCTPANVPEELEKRRKKQDGALRKTGDALKDWLRPRSKPEIARLVAGWLQRHPQQLSENLKKLIMWSVS